MRDILGLFPELSYDEHENLVKFDLCYVEQSKGGSVSGQFRYRKDFDKPSDKMRQEFIHMTNHLKAHF